MMIKWHKATIVWTLLCAAMPLQATMVEVDIGGGWKAVWDGSLCPTVDVNPLAHIGKTVFIQKSAQFTQPPVNGVFPSIPIVFEQTAYPAAENIVIDDEIIGNSTGFDWTDFHFDLLDGPDAAFDPDATAASGGGPPIGFSISPFTAAAFSQGDTRLDVWGGVLGNGQYWFAGNGATDGQLWIDVVPKRSEPYAVFTLKETPTPEPATLSLIAVCGLALLRRRSS